MRGIDVTGILIANPKKNWEWARVDRMACTQGRCWRRWSASRMMMGAFMTHMHSHSFAIPSSVSSDTGYVLIECHVVEMMMVMMMMMISTAN